MQHIRRCAHQAHAGRRWETALDSSRMFVTAGHARGQFHKKYA